MQVHVLAFAQTRDQLGWEERIVECVPEESARTILARLAPQLSLDTMRVAIDQEYQPWDEPIGEAREIALIPPVSGG